MTVPFRSETEFEDAVIDTLTRHGWEEVIHNPTADDLIINWAHILYENNREQDRLGNVPLTESEMQQIIEQIIELRTPLRLNEFINGRSVTITRDAPNACNKGKEVSLKIYDRLEISGGQSRYQIARQPRYTPSTSHLLPKRRGDLMLLINGMPVIHLELKNSGVPVSQATNQIEKYAYEGVYTNIFSLVQVFVGMTPDETVYFANPGPNAQFNPDFFFHWADFNNEPVNEWDKVVKSLLSIPMAHQLIGFYTVADRDAGNLMVMRSYQYFAASRIADRVETHEWGVSDPRGGYIWHATGSGKTITSFKTAQLIADSKNADKVVFLLDRIELGEQSLGNYRSYAGDAIEVEDTANSERLLTLLKDNHTTLIVTSIQKMSMLHKDSIRVADLEKIQDKRIVFIIDEAHRSTFGEMLNGLTKTLPNALRFGFTGTPIHNENQKVSATTATVFGNELHRYSIADGIRDRNVLGFDPTMVQTFRDIDLRKQVALAQSKATDEKDALADPVKAKVFNLFMDKVKTPMAGFVIPSGKRIKGIEDYVPHLQYNQPQHREAVVKDIMEHWTYLTQDSKFHAILATSSIPEAIEYFRLFRSRYPEINVTALFDPHIDNTGQDQLVKEDGLVEILTDYNAVFGQSFTISTHAGFKRDVSARLAHKKPYNATDFTPEKQIHLLIVVDQMLTGFDSKYVNTLFLDKVIAYENVIQAFSRTSRVYGPEKPFGSIRYYRRPHTMQRNIDNAIKLYSGDKPFGMFASDLGKHLNGINDCFTSIKELFSEYPDFSRLPSDQVAQMEFAKQFSELYQNMQAARVQGFSWEKNIYRVDSESVTVEITEPVYMALISRYKELDSGTEGGARSESDVPFDINTHITHIDTGRIDSDYLNSKYNKYLRARNSCVPQEELNRLLEDLHTSFARLPASDQKYANRWLHDIQSGDAVLHQGKTVQDYINEYRISQRNREIERLVGVLGVGADQLEVLLSAGVSETNINEYGRFDALMQATDIAVAQRYFEQREGTGVSKFKVRRALDALLRRYIVTGVLPADLALADEDEDTEAI